jgi:hypothetical protein
MRRGRYLGRSLNGQVADESPDFVSSPIPLRGEELEQVTREGDNCLASGTATLLRRKTPRGISVSRAPGDRDPALSERLAIAAWLPARRAATPIACAVPAAPAGIRRAGVGPGGQGEGVHARGGGARGGRSCRLSSVPAAPAGIRHPEVGLEGRGTGHTRWGNAGGGAVMLLLLFWIPELPMIEGLITVCAALSACC